MKRNASAMDMEDFAQCVDDVYASMLDYIEENESVSYDDAYSECVAVAETIVEDYGYDYDDEDIDDMVDTVMYEFSDDSRVSKRAGRKVSMRGLKKKCADRDMSKDVILPTLQRKIDEYNSMWLDDMPAWARMDYSVRKEKLPDGMSYLVEVVDFSERIAEIKYEFEDTYFNIISGLEIAVQQDTGDSYFYLEPSYSMSDLVGRAWPTKLGRVSRKFVGRMNRKASYETEDGNFAIGDIYQYWPGGPWFEITDIDGNDVFLEGDDPDFPLWTESGVLRQELESNGMWSRETMAFRRKSASRSCRNVGGRTHRMRRNAQSISDNWRGNPAIRMRYYNEWADPDLLYKDYVFNYWDIENALWDEFLELGGDPNDEAGFDRYVQEFAVDYLEDCIFGGYFQDGSKTWHR